MSDRTVRVAAAAILLLASAHAAMATERPASARACPDNLPEGVRLPPRPGCDDGRTVGSAPRGDGFRDLGGGVRVRIDGRASTELGVRR